MSLIKSIVISREVGIAKPDTAVFNSALQGLAVERKSACHVENSLMTDVLGARAASLTEVWLNRRGLPRREVDPEPDIRVRSLSPLKVLLSGTWNRYS